MTYDNYLATIVLLLRTRMVRARLEPNWLRYMDCIHETCVREDTYAPQVSGPAVDLLTLISMYAVHSPCTVFWEFLGSYGGL